MTTQAIGFTVMELAREHAKSISKQSLGERVLDLITHVAKRWACAVLDDKSRRLTDAAVWFRGAAAEVDRHDVAEPIDPDFEMVDQIRANEAALMAARSDLLKALAELQTIRSRPSVNGLSAAMTRTASASADLYEALRDFRGAIQAYEANCCARQHAHHPISDPDELEAELMRITSGA